MRKRSFLALGLLLFARSVAPNSANVEGGAGRSESGRLIADARPADDTIGTYGGRLVVPLRSEPKTLNPVLAADNYSRDVIWRTMGDLIHINRFTQQTESALALSWQVSRDGRRYTLQLRPDLKFSDGHAADADDVIFSFEVYLDAKVNSPQRDLLVVGGKPIEVRKIDAHTVEFDLSQPYGAGERIFDSIAILPRHLLEPGYRAGKFSEMWGVNARPIQIAGLGPFKLKEFVLGQRVVLEKNPYYWKQDRSGNTLPYLSEIIFVFIPSADSEVLRFQSGDVDLETRLNAQNFSLLGEKGAQLVDGGSSLEYSFLCFNQNDLRGRSLPEVSQRQEWFAQKNFRQAVSLAIDRQALVRLVYKNRAEALWGNVTPGIKLWRDAALPAPARSLDKARELLRAAGFRISTSSDGTPVLYDSHNQPVNFTLATSSSNAERVKMAALIQADLQELGMRVQVVPLEFRALLDRVFQTYDYDACLMSLASGDADPTADINVWRSNGAQHLWHLGESKPASTWESEVDVLLDQQLITTDTAERRRVYNRVQEIIAENAPVVFLVSPHMLAAAKPGLGNFRPAVMEPPTLWNADVLYWKK
ncbi:MAG TPA: ABC transporter substrate-binding protein [Candidatus Acidoferrales bacterium]|nr:ABC transporter substrate-binding protein [Candidatus Acidoferrales bacterium]